MNILITLAAAAFIGGSALLVTSVAPDASVHTEQHTQAQVSSETQAAKDSDASLTAKLKSLLHLDSDADTTPKESSVEVETDVNGGATTSGTSTKAHIMGSGLIDLSL